jgi:hypothetical protein
LAGVSTGECSVHAVAGGWRALVPPRAAQVLPAVSGDGRGLLEKKWKHQTVRPRGHVVA